MTEAEPAGTNDDADAGRRPRLAFLSFSSGEFDARTARMARTALRAGFDVVVYARDHPRLPAVERRDGYVVRRVPWRAWMAIPGLARARLLLHRPARAEDAVATTASAAASSPAAPDPARARLTPRRVAGGVRRRLGRLASRIGIVRTAQTMLMFPVRPLGWSRALDGFAEPADVWHGMWAGSLPALVRQSRRLGGRTIYDSRDVYMESRNFAVAPAPVRRLLARLERGWAQRVDRVVTVNDGYADLVARQLRVSRPPVLRNVPARWTPPDPPPDRIREALGLPASTAIVLYQGQLISDRGIEPAMEAILEVDGAVLVLLGYGGLRAWIAARAAEPPYRGKVFLLPAVPPDELLAWTASADVSVMPIAPTSINHRYTTPQKLFESIAAGVPVVASDLPGMAGVVREADAGVLCDPRSPASIAAAIRTLVDEPPGARKARRERLLAVAHERYAWEVEEARLVALYRELAGLAGPVAATPEAPEG